MDGDLVLEEFHHVGFDRKQVYSCMFNFYWILVVVTLQYQVRIFSGEAPGWVQGAFFAVYQSIGDLWCVCGKYGVKGW